MNSVGLNNLRMKYQTPYRNLKRFCLRQRLITPLTKNTLNIENLQICVNESIMLRVGLGELVEGGGANTFTSER